MRALERIWAIVHNPSKKTNHKGAIDHYQADFDEIRKQIKPFVDAGFMRPNSPPQSEDQK
jgi:hypothetical protein